MRKVFIDDLPKNKTRINWNDAVGHVVKFIYDDICGEVEIIAYNNENKNISIKSEEFRNGDTFDIYVTSFKSALLGGYVGKQMKEYRFLEGEVLKTNSLDVEIIKQIKIKGRKSYLYRCNKCGALSKSREDQLMLEGYGCGVCNNSICRTGINDIMTTHPHLANYFARIEDCRTNSINTHKKVDIVCPDCGAIRTMSVIKFHKRPFRCHVCSDGRSYPEKFVAAILEYENIEYVTQLCKTQFEWCGDKRYDFYIPKFKCIIEANGKQHYEESTRGKSLEEERQNDLYKEKLAKDNGIEYYISLDCSESNPTYISNSILESGMSGILGINIGDVEICKYHELASKSRMVKVCNVWNSGITSVKEINKLTGVSLSAIRSYLRQCDDIGLCSYRK